MIRGAKTARTGAGLRLRARASAIFFGAVVTVTDLVPPHFRYGYVHPLTRRIFRGTLPVVQAVESGEVSRSSSSSSAARPGGPTALTCVLLTGSMDIGGIGSVVEMLASELSTVGIRPVVVCTDDGKRAARLRARGIEVAVVDPGFAASTLARLAPDVIELHGAPEALEDAAIASGIPLVPVFHNTEIHYSRARWQRLARLLERSAAGVSVSALVRDFHIRHLPASFSGRIEVVPNAAPHALTPSDEERGQARQALAEALDLPLTGETVVVSLARYDSQKNVAGLVASFLATVSDPLVRLVIAGEPSDWAEVRRADAIRRSHASGDRVSFLSTSDARTLLASGDAFVLDSFFEGWPVAATEAAVSGLPLVLSDHGGARELVARDPEHSVLIANPCGRAETVTDAAVARGRRLTRRQVNAAELGAAIDRVVSGARSGARPVPGDTKGLMDAMMEGHASVLRAASVRGGGEGIADAEQVERGRQ